MEHALTHTIGFDEGFLDIDVEYIRADDMVKLGWLYLNRGLWNGKRLLSEK